MNACITRETFVFTVFRRVFHSTLKLELCRHACRRRDPIISTCRYGKNMPTTALVATIECFHITSAEWAGGNNKSVGILQPGHWFAEHKHTYWITQNRYALVHSVCMISRGIAPQTNCGARWSYTPVGEHCHHFTSTTLDWFTFDPVWKHSIRILNKCSSSIP